MWLALSSLLLAPCGNVAGGIARASDDAKIGGTTKTETAIVASHRSALKAYTRDLVREAAEQTVAAESIADESSARDARRLARVLARSAKNNPVFVDSTGADAVRALVRLIHTGEQSVGGRTRVVELDIAAVIDGAKDEAEISARLRRIFAEAEAARAILFVDTIDSFVGSTAVYGAPISRALVSALERGSLRVIGATARTNYDANIASDERLAALFDPLGAEDEEKAEVADGAEFVGDKISPDLRDLIDGVSANPDADGRATVILQADDIRDPEMRGILSRHNADVDFRSRDSRSLVAQLPLAGIEELASSERVRHISLDRDTEFLGHVSQVTGADVANGMFPKSMMPALGGGVRVAVLDSGVDPTHASFKNGWQASRVVVSRNFVTTDPQTRDTFGHGTHVAGLIAGGSRSSASKGVAEGAEIVSLRVLDGWGRGKTAYLLAALDWVLANHAAQNIRVANLSLGALAIETYKNDPICRKVRQLTDAGIVVVTAAGNSGKNQLGKKAYGSIHSPGNEPSAITVGAANTFGTLTRTDDVVTTYSSRGPTRSSYKDSTGRRRYDNVLKPDLVAPGNMLISAAAKDNRLRATYPALAASGSDANGDATMYLSGTSVSAPLVSGTVARMLTVNSKLTPGMIRAFLQYTATQIRGANLLEQGAGQLNVHGAITLA